MTCLYYPVQSRINNDNTEEQDTYQAARFTAAAAAKYRKQSGQKLIGFVKVSTAVSLGNCRSRLHLQLCIYLLADFIISMSSLYVLSW